jgi:hypothetical protein
MLLQVLKPFPPEYRDTVASLSGEFTRFPEILNDNRGRETLKNKSNIAPTPKLTTFSTQYTSYFAGQGLSESFPLFETNTKKTISCLVQLYYQNHTIK